jgi:hypothetical protein
MSIVKTPAGRTVMPSVGVSYASQATSTLVGADAAELLDGLTEVRDWLRSLVVPGVLEPLVAAGRPEFKTTPDGSDLVDKLELVSGLYGEPDPRLIDEVEMPLHCGDIGGLTQVGGWLEWAEHLMRKFGRTSLNVELPEKLDEVLTELACALVECADDESEALTFPSVKTAQLA